MQIKQNEIGLVYKNGQFEKLLKAGKYNLFFVNVEVYSLNERFEPKSAELNILLQFKSIADELNIIDVKETEIAIRFEGGILKEVLKSGKYAYWKCAVELSKFEIFSLQTRLVPKIIDLNNLLQQEKLSGLLQTVEVKDDEICLHYQDGILFDVLKSGKYAFWKSLTKNEFRNVNIINPVISDEIPKQLINNPKLAIYINTISVEPFEKGLFFLNNKFQEILEPDFYYFWKLSKIVARIDKVDMRQQQIEINGQEIMSKDKVTLRFNFVCQYKIIDPKRTFLEIKDFTNELYILLQLVLREYVGGFTLDEILLKKQEIGDYVTQNLKENAFNLGLDLIFAGVKDVILPGEIKDILNQVLIAEKKAQANVIMRREETASTRSLLNTAKLMEDNELLYKLKELEYIERISEKINQISISGGSQILEQLKQIFISNKNGNI